MCFKKKTMQKRTIILTQHQLDEIVGGDASYLDNINNDFKEDGANSISPNGKLDDKDAEPIMTDKVSSELSRNQGLFGNRSISLFSPSYVCCSKKDWLDKNIISEDNQNLVNKTYGDNTNRVSNTNASTLKWRYGAAKKKAQSSDPTIRQQGISTMKTMEKNNPNLAQIETQYNSAMANDANLKKSAFERGEENVYQAPNQHKTPNNGQAHTKKPVGQVITYESKTKENKIKQDYKK